MEIIESILNYALISTIVVFGIIFIICIVTKLSFEKKMTLIKSGYYIFTPVEIGLFIIHCIMGDFTECVMNAIVVVMCIYNWSNLSKY